MKIELKNIKHSETLSEETNAFTATLYADDTRVGQASNHERGGPTEMHAYDVRGQEFVKQAEEWCKTLPPIHFQSGNQDHVLDMDFEHCFS